MFDKIKAGNTVGTDASDTVKSPGRRALFASAAGFAALTITSPWRRSATTAGAESLSDDGPVELDGKKFLSYKGKENVIVSESLSEQLSNVLHLIRMNAELGGAELSFDEESCDFSYAIGKSISYNFPLAEDEDEEDAEYTSLLIDGSEDYDGNGNFALSLMYERKDGDREQIFITKKRESAGLIVSRKHIEAQESRVVPKSHDEITA